ncbi:MAG: YerC/YecD family TrpR-related protein [Candidatus Saccharibacteria bacterium]
MAEFKPQWSNETTDYLIKALKVLQTEEEIYRFLDDICTISELEAIAQRLQVARLLARQETYNKIAAQTGASTATISRVKKYLVYGAGGYELVLTRLKETGEEE